MKHWLRSPIATQKPMKHWRRCLVTGSVLVISYPSTAPANQPGPLPSFEGVHSGSASVGVSGHTLTVNQTSQTATLDWNSFNIAAGNNVVFNQTQGSSAIALNNIHDANASQILGNLTANGQVYLVNHNGIVFGPNSSANVNSLVATSLTISDTVFKNGIVNQNSGASLGAAFTCDATAGPCQNITVDKGATIFAADAGRVILAAPIVENDGAITAPDGQVILVAATDKVYLQESNSSELRGLLVEVQTGGDVKNLGTILSERGNSTMMGFAVSQQGVLSASTSVALNGSVRLLAREGAQLVNSSNDNSSTSANFVLEPLTTNRSIDRSKVLTDGLGTQASVTLASRSSTNITLDNSDGTTIAKPIQPQSIVDVEAGYIDMQAGSKIIAPGGVVNLNANLSPSLSNVTFSATASPNDKSVANISRILLETGSNIDVSGAQNVPMLMSDNIVNLTLYSYELRNDPVQQHGKLYGQNVYVDARLGTSLADVTGVEAARQYSVAYLNAKAGSVNLSSEGDVIVQQGAKINISGGSLDYQGGLIPATYLYSNGALYSMANANPKLIYQKIFNTEYYQTGYRLGMDAGTVAIKSRDLVLDGSILATTTYGQFQRNAADLPKGGSLNIDTTWSGLTQQDVEFQTSQTYTATSQYDKLLQSDIYLSNAVFGNGLSNFSLISGGNLTIDQNVNLTLPDFGSLNLQAGSIHIYGSISDPAGMVTLSSNGFIDSAHSLNGEIQLGQIPVLGAATGSSIDVSGLWINDFIASLHGAPLQPLPINSGSITIKAQGDLVLDRSAKLIANGGAWLQQNLKLSDGSGGNITLTTAGNNIGTALQLGASLSSYSLNNGGILSITANSIDIAGKVQNQADNSTALDLTAGFLESGGFSSYQLTANAGNLTIETNTAIVLQQTNWQLNTAAYKVASGMYLSSLVSPFKLPENLRNPVDLSLNLKQNTSISGYVADRSIHIGQNAVISTDPGAALNLTSDANISLAGTLYAPTGTINLTLTALDNSTAGYNPQQAIVLNAGSDLNASGAVVATPSSARLKLGTVLDGGTISLTANTGYILTDANSSINVSGANAALDIINSRGISLQNVASNAGTINLTAAEGLFLEGAFMAQPGLGQTAAGSGSVAAGGTLNLTLSAQNIGNTVDTAPAFPTTPLVFHISEKPLNNLNLAQIENGSLTGLAYISSSQIKQAGFDSLKLASLVTPLVSYAPNGGAIIFDGDVSFALKLSLELDAPLIGHSWASATDSGQVALSTDMFTLGSSLNQTAIGSLNGPITAINANGVNAIFSVTANNIELRGAGLISGFAKTTLDSSGDISLLGVTNPNNAITQSLVGSLGLTGELDLQAREIYPTTMSQFTISINAELSPNGLIKIQPPNSGAYTPLSAAGQLNLSAPNIDSYGNLLAPFGRINLSASSTLILESGSLTSVSDSDNTLIPFGRTQGSGLYWQYPILTNANYLNATPQKAITLGGLTINLRSGSEVDLNGGGDLLAYELVQAPPAVSGGIGSIDYLSRAYQQSYVVIPTLKSGFAPYDFLEFPGSGLKPGENVYLSAAAQGLAAGNYVLLPSYYAFLPGAYLITPQAGTGNMTAGTRSLLPDGATVVAGYLETAGSNISASLWSGFEVQPGSVALSYSPYQLSYASQFFAANSTTAGISPSLPQDAGNLSLQAGGSLNLAGEIYATATSRGLGGQLDISGDNFIIGGQSGSTEKDTVFINALQLNGLGVDSILIGGTRTRTGSSTKLTVKSSSVEVMAGALTASEIILAATDSIKLEKDSAISAIGSLSRTDSLLNISNAGSSNSDGALLRVSSAGQAQILRSSHSGNNGVLQIDAGATLTSAGSILLDSGKSGSLLGAIEMTQGQLTLSGNLITLGGATDQNAGFQLSNTVLNQLHADSLTLESATTVNIEGAVALQQANLNLTIDSLGIAGSAGTGQTAVISAANITLQNSTGKDTPIGLSATGLGQLTLQASTITLGSGNYSLNGFNQINFNATKALIDSGVGTVSIVGNLTIASPVWTSVSGANTSLNLGAHSLSMFANGVAASTSGLGGVLMVNAGQIDDQGRIDLGAGQVNLNALSDLNLATGSLIDVSGRTVTLGGNLVYTVGGAINLTSNTGNIDIQKHALLNVSGANLGGNAGSLKLSAVDGAVTLAGDIQGFGHQGVSGGNFMLDAQYAFYTASLGGLNSDFSTLSTLLQNGEFNGNISVHQGQGNIVVAAADQVNAANITLTADNGSVDVAGTLNVSAAQAGSIQLSGNKSLVKNTVEINNSGVLIESTAKLYAETGNPAYQGGSIILTSDPISKQSAGVTIASGAELNVSGGSAGGALQGGSVHVIANRVIDSNGNDNAQVNLANGAVHGATDLVVYAMAHYIDQTLSNTQLQQWLTEGAYYVYLNAPEANTIPTNLGNFSMQPGLDIQSSSSLTWNIATPLNGAGLLSIRSAIDIDIDQTLSDGFTVSSNGQVSLLSGPTWSYSIVAGADLNSASLNAILGSGGVGNLSIESNTSINTGSGAIYLAAAGNIKLTDDTSTVYTAGQPALTDPYASSRTKTKSYTYTVQYPDDGGSVTLNAGGNIIGAASTQLISDWLQRSGNLTNPSTPGKGNLPTAWGIDFGKTTPTSNSTLGFRENIGTLGGGNINIHAGGNIQDLSVMQPTTAVSSVANGISELHEQGGGNLSVTADGNIAGGVFYVEKGYADIRVGGAITGGNQYTSGPVFGLGAAQFNVTAGDGIQVSAVLNPFLIVQVGSSPGFFSTYSTASGITLQSLAGDINLNNNSSLIMNQVQQCFSSNCLETASWSTSVYNSSSISSDVYALLALYPGNLTANALTGAIQVNSSMSMAPASGGSFELLAADNVTFGADVVLNQLDLNPILLQSVLSITEPQTTFSSSTDFWVWTPYSFQGANAHNSESLHEADSSTNLIVSDQGNVIGLGDGGTVNSAKALTVSTGKDLNNVSLIIQNLNSVNQDVSSINVGGDIIYPSTLNSVTGVVQGSTSAGIIAAGPGVLNVWAGGNVNLGDSGGITSVGSQFNPNLPTTGASITVLAGEPIAQNIQSLNDYLQTYVNADYRNSLSDQLSALLQQPAGSNDQQWAMALENLQTDIAAAQANLGSATTTSARLQLALPILFAQFNLAAIEAIATGNANFQAEYDAINQLFPNKPGGDISLNYSEIQTLAGGDINLLAPGGMLNIGLASSDISSGKSPAQLGVVAQAQGNINILTQLNVLINQSRVFALKGGNISIWSSNGNIDAGRGANSSLGTQFPTGSYDAGGNLILEYPATVSGSGIRAQSGYNSNIIGDVTLIAPHGVINANEAGIRGKKVILPTPYIPSPNISGSIVILPGPPVVVLSPTVGNVMAAASKSTSSNLVEDDMNGNESLARKSANVTYIYTDVIGFGNCSIGDVQAGVAGCGGK